MTLALEVVSELDVVADPEPVAEPELLMVEVAAETVEDDEVSPIVPPYT